MNTLEAKQAHELSSQFYFFQLIFAITGIICWTYYVYLLIRSAHNDYGVIFLNFGVVAITQLLGFIVSAIFVGKIGYLTSFRIHNFIMLVVTLLVLVTLPNILNVYLAFAALRGFGYGFFWMANNVYTQREVFGLQRGRLISILNGAGAVLGIALPVLAGATIVSAGYQWIFMVTAAVYFVGIIYPWKYNKVPRDVFRSSEIKNFSKRKGFKQWSIFLVVNEIFGDQRNTIITILPFAFIGNEFNVGVLTSGLGLLAALLIFWHRNDEIKRKVHYGYWGAGIVDIATTFLGVVWSLPALIIRSVIANFGFSYYSPVESELAYRVKESLLGDFSQESATEMQVYAESMYTIARVFNLIMAVFLFYMLKFDPITVLQGLLLLGAGRELVFMLFNTRLLERLKR